MLVFFKRSSYVFKFDTANSKHHNNIFIHKSFRCCFCSQRVAEWYSWCDARTAFKFKRIFCTLPRSNWCFNWFFLRSLTCSTRNLPFACILTLFSCNYTVFFFVQQSNGNWHMHRYFHVHMIVPASCGMSLQSNRLKWLKLKWSKPQNKLHKHSNRWCVLFLKAEIPLRSWPLVHHRSFTFAAIVRA